MRKIKFWIEEEESEKKTLLTLNSPMQMILNRFTNIFRTVLMRFWLSADARKFCSVSSYLSRHRMLQVSCIGAQIFRRGKRNRAASSFFSMRRTEGGKKGSFCAKSRKRNETEKKENDPRRRDTWFYKPIRTHMSVCRPCVCQCMHCSSMIKPTCTRTRWSTWTCASRGCSLSSAYWRSPHSAWG